MFLKRFLRAKPAAANLSATRLHLGCGSVHLDGYLNLDSDPGSAADRQLDIREVGTSFAESSIEEILMIHSISYLRLWEAREFFRTVLKLLRPGGKFIAEFPDIMKCAQLMTASEPGGAEYLEAVRAIYAFDLKQIQNHEPYYPYHFGWSAGHFIKELRAAGFTDIQILPSQTHGPRPFRDTRIEAVKP